MSTAELLMAPQGGGGDRSSESSSGSQASLKRSSSEGAQEINGVTRRSSPPAAPSPEGAAAVVVASDEGAPNGGEGGCGIAQPADAAMAAAAPRRIAAAATELQPPQPTSAAATPSEESAPACSTPVAEASDRLRPRPAAAPSSTTPAVNAVAATAVASAEPDAASNAESTGQRTRRRKKRKPEGSPTLQVSLHNSRNEAVRCPSPSSPSQSPQLGARSPCFDGDRTATSAAVLSLDASSENAAAVGDSQGSLDRASDSSRSSQTAYECQIQLTCQLMPGMHVMQPLAPPSLLGCPSEIGMSPRPSPEGTREPLSRSLEKSTDSKGSNKMLEKKKKTSSWYNMLNPTYKSRSEDFKRLFKDLPETERLIVDYSCALQRDILVHGRLYVTQNFICFYANIFRWETNVVIRCKDVTSMTKEKTARVIPNAVQVCTDHERHFFTSFGARDKTYLMLFRIWQNALMEQPMSTQELWQWVHYSYGDELGLTSDDDDYVAPPYLEDEARRGRLAAALKAGPQPPSLFEEELPNGEDDEDEEASGPELFASAREAQHSEMPTDLSDSSDTAEPPECPSTHEGRQILNLTLPLSVDQLFTLLFTGSRFFHDLLTSRKTYDVTESNWQPCPETGNKLRQLTYTVTLNHAMAKAAQTTETQILHKASRPGHVYAIDCDVQSTGVPYCDAFCVKSHYCLARLSDSRSRLCIYGCVRYKKSVWGLVKAVIEKNTQQGLEGFCNDLESALLREAERLQPSGGNLKQRRRRLQGTKRSNANRDHSSSSQAGFGSSFVLARSSESRRLATSTAVKVLLVLVSLVLLMNIALLYWLWASNAMPDRSPTLDVWVLEPPPQNAEDWVRLMSQREAFHRQRLDLWQRALHDLRHQLHMMESSLQRLQQSLQMAPVTNSSVPLPTAPSSSSPGDL
ncbi:protein Aster-B-like isoform X1 [Dermacentor andersoni]|uniref:protein Aster-B-like isoform X1 n=1 Tax=Dermacentor andersoni TaxID=34620 RepID=UPI002155642F|nr:protein Aster-B-like isoform X1 [Dermacentor andersoni]